MRSLICENWEQGTGNREQEKEQVKYVIKSVRFVWVLSVVDVLVI
jgi:hypothetical protein